MFKSETSIRCKRLYQPGRERPGERMSGRGLDPSPLSGGEPPRPKGRGFPRLDDSFRGPLVAFSMAVVLVACRHDKPNVVYMPDMVYSPAIKAQKIGSMRMPVAGTVERSFERYPYPQDPELAGKELKNPLKPTTSVLRRGKHIYDTYCIVCHGPSAEGNGFIVPRYPQPPNLHSEKVRNWTDGRIYHVVTMGQNLMPSYASQIVSGDRWAAIHYLRAMQRSKNPTEDDVKVFEQESK